MVLLFEMNGFRAQAGRGPYDWALISLDYIRKEKQEKLEHYWNHMEALAQKAEKDESVRAFHRMNRRYAAARQKGQVPATLDENIAALRKEFNRYYVEHYYNFYDMLFVNLKGDVFYTIRKEEDLARNLLEQSASSPLAKKLQTKPARPLFVDFHYYGPSMEPAAFFIRPVREENELTGWLVLQCAINQINALFSVTPEMGLTGESFLVNREGYMLSESRFTGGSTILNKKLDDRNIQAKFQEQKGHRTVTDYRGKRALSSFAVFTFQGVQWLVVAKMDKDEVLTRHYLRHDRYYADTIAQSITQGPHPALGKKTTLPELPRQRIDMDEFLRAQTGHILETWGISTCTGLLIAYPRNFAYLAHISNKDVLLGGRETRLFEQMIHKVQNFDIFPAQKGEILFVLTAPHLTSLAPIIKAILEEGYLLSQIRVLYHPSAHSASLAYDYQTAQLEVQWRGDPIKGPAIHHLKDAWKPAELLDALVQEEETHSSYSDE